MLRKRVLASTKINIEHVPCILHINKTTGVVEQYEGEKSFQLIESLIEEPPEPSPVIQEQPVVTPIEMTEIEEEPNTSSRKLKQKISATDIMTVAKTREADSAGQQQQPPIQGEPIEQKKTGKPVDIAAAMSAAQSRRE